MQSELKFRRYHGDLSPLDLESRVRESRDLDCLEQHDFEPNGYWHLCSDLVIEGDRLFDSVELAQQWMGERLVINGLLLAVRAMVQPADLSLRPHTIWLVGGKGEPRKVDARRMADPDYLLSLS